MAKKKSIHKSVDNFINSTEEIKDFLNVTNDLSDKFISWIYQYSIIKLYSDFENLILHLMVAALNQDTSTFSDMKSINFPKNLNDDVCEYLIIANGYFDFKGRDDLIRKVKQFIPDNHYILETLRNSRYSDSIKRLCALRNFAAHNSKVSKKRVLNELGIKRIYSSGTWLKIKEPINRLTRLEIILNDFTDFAEQIKERAPY
ncbi:MAG: hypothetical protein ACYCX4_06955 [Bacillota bacterium]